MKNLANCSPSEFLRQTNRIRKSVSKWLTDTDILNIRKRLPEISEKASDEEREKLKMEQAKKNFNAILDAVLDEHPDETLEILALCCFVEPKDVDNHTIEEYFDALNELISNRAVVSFFMSLNQLANRLT